MQSGQDTASTNALSRAPADRTLFAQLPGLLREHRTAYLLAAVLFLGTLGMSLVQGEEFLPFLGVYGRRVLRAMAIVLPAAMVFVMLTSMLRGEPAIAALRANALAAVRSGLFMRVLLALAMFTVFMASFLFNKMRIPDIVPFSWDVAFADLDRIVFLGAQPWEMLQPVLGYPLVTVFLDMMYSFWVALTVIFWLLAAASRTRAGQRYLLATVLSWTLLGLVMATVLSSAGPVYFPMVAVGAEDPYVGLNAYLRAVGDTYMLSSDWMKTYLWEIHNGRLDEPGGISAMPSMHNVQAVLFAAFAYRLNRKLGHAMAFYAVVIFFGSIHLAWHYAVDSLFGIVAALVVWRLTAMLLPATGEDAQRPNTSRA